MEGISLTACRSLSHSRHSGSFGPRPLLAFLLLPLYTLSDTSARFLCLMENLRAPVSTPAGRGPGIRTRSPFNPVLAILLRAVFAKLSFLLTKADGAERCVSHHETGKHQWNGDLEIPHSPALPSKVRLLKLLPRSALCSSQKNTPPPFLPVCLSLS